MPSPTSAAPPGTEKSEGRWAGSGDPVGQPPATAARCLGAERARPADPVHFPQITHRGLEDPPSRNENETGRGWGVRPADGRSRTLPGTLGEGARHRAGRDRRLYGYLSTTGGLPRGCRPRRSLALPCRHALSNSASDFETTGRPRSGGGRREVSKKENRPGIARPVRHTPAPRRSVRCCFSKGVGIKS